MPPKTFLTILAKAAGIVNLVVSLFRRIRRTRAKDDIAQLPNFTFTMCRKFFGFTLACILGVDRLALAFVCQVAVRAVAVHGIGLDVVVEVYFQDALDPFFMRREFDRCHQFDAFVEVARHPVCRRNEDVFLAAVVEVEQAAVFQEAADDAVDFDVFADARQARADDADAADDEADLDAGCRRFIELGDDVLIEERIHLGHDDSFLAGLGLSDFLIDFLTEQDAVYVTNGIMHAKKLTQKGCIVYLIGGELKEATLALVGEEAMKTLGRYHFTKGFFGTNGIHIESGCTTPDIREAAIKEMAILRSAKAYILADSTKFGQVAPVTFSELDAVDIITTKLKDATFNKYKNIVEVAK